MRIERVVIRDLRALRSRDDILLGPDGIWDSVCLRGLNGSGKTTWLEAVAQVWQWFRRCTTRMRYTEPEAKSLLHEAGLVAVLLAGLPGPRTRMWVAWGKQPALQVLRETEELVPLAGGPTSRQWEPGLLEWWAEAFERAIVGGASVPNFVIIESKRKYVRDFRPSDAEAALGGPAYYPVARHVPEGRGSSHLEGLMRTLALALPERWAMLVKEFGRLRKGRLVLLDRFDATTQRPVFETADGARITADKLSAGEVSVLINLCMVLRWLEPGGVVMLDEPELHQHLSLMRGSLAVLETLLRETMQGQLIVASHAPEVWNHYRLTGTFVELDS